MRYWDSSAMLSLLVWEESTELRRRHLEQDPEISTWWGSRVECVSALNRLLRDKLLDDEAFERSVADVEDHSSGWTEILPTEMLRQRAMPPGRKGSAS